MKYIYDRNRYYGDFNIQEQVYGVCSKGFHLSSIEIIVFVDPDHSVAKPDLYVVNLDHAVAETDPSFADPDHEGIRIILLRIGIILWWILFLLKIMSTSIKGRLIKYKNNKRIVY